MGSKFHRSYHYNWEENENQTPERLKMEADILVLEFQEAPGAENIREQSPLCSG